MRYIGKKLRWFLLLALMSGLLTGCGAEAKKDRHLERADQYFAAGQYPQAEVEYFNVLRAENTNAHALGQLGMMYCESGRTFHAIPFLVKASKLNTNDTELKLKLATVYLAVGGTQDAWNIATNVLQKTPKDAVAPLILAEASRTPEGLKDARQHLETLARTGGETAPLDVALSSLLVREKKLNEAEALLRKATSLDPKYPEAHHALGKVLWAKTNLTDAAEELKSAAELSPPRSPQKIQYATFLLRIGKTQEGKDYLDSMTKNVPDYLPAWVLLAETAFAERTYPESEKLIKEALARDQDYYDAILLDARLKLVTTNTDQAVKELQRLATLYPQSPQARFFLGMARLQQNDPAKALNEFNQAVKLYPDFDDALTQRAQLNIQMDNAPAAVTSLAQMIKRRPDYAPAYLVLSSAYLLKANFDEALLVYQSMEKQFPTNAEVPLLIGTVLERQGKKAEARANFEKARQLAPENLQCLEVLVNLDIAEKKLTDAAKKIQEQILKLPKSPELQTLWGKVLIAQQQFEQAESALRKALEFKSDFLPARRFLVDLYLSTKKNQQAIDELQIILGKNTADQTALLQMGLAQTQMKNYAAAAAAYEKLLAINPNASIVYNNLAYIYSENLNQPDKAYDAARKARELLPRDPSTADTLGWILYQRGDFSRALDLLQESADKFTNQPDVLFHLGMTQYMLGQIEPAKISLQHALQTGQDFSGKAEANQRLSVINLDEKDPKSVAILEKILTEHPDDPVALSKLAGIYETHHELDKALKLYQKAVAQNPKSLAANLKLAQLYSGSFKDDQKALQYAKAARTLAPDDPNITYLLGKLAYASRDYIWASSLFQESQRRTPKNADLLYDRAFALLTVGQVGDAASTMQEVLNIDPNFSRANNAKRFLTLIAIQSEPKNALVSVGLIDEVLKTSPQDLGALVAKGLMQMQKPGMAAEARKTFETILQNYPQFYPANKYLAQLYALPNGDFQKAYDYAVQARSAFPSDPVVAKTLGILTYDKNDFDRAAQLLKEASIKLSEDAEVFFYLGMAQNNLKQKTETQTSLRRAMSLDLDARKMAMAKAILAETSK